MQDEFENQKYKNQLKPLTKSITKNHRPVKAPNQTVEEPCQIVNLEMRR